MIHLSVITVCYNSADALADTLRSVSQQCYPEVEHLIVDGASQDHTLAVIRQVGSHVAQVLSEPDKGLYDAMNKGLQMARGDFVGFLNAGDIYLDDQVLNNIAQVAAEQGNDFVYGDLFMVDAVGQQVREWRVGPLSRRDCTQIPHPTLFVRRALLNELSPAFDVRYSLAADVKQQLVLYKKGAQGSPVGRSLVQMRLGGMSTARPSCYVAGWLESMRAYNEVFGRGGIGYVIKKVLSKIPKPALWWPYIRTMTPFRSTGD